MYVIRDRLKYRAKVRTKSQSENTGFTDGLQYKDVEERGIHIRKHFIFTSDIPRISEYLRAMIGMLFRTQNELEIMVEKLRLREGENLI
jgi:hypothetical protein